MMSPRIDVRAGHAHAGRWVTPTHGGIAATSVAFTSGRVHLVQFQLPEARVVDGITYVVGATADGNVTAGIIGPVAVTADTAQGAAVLVQSTSTAQGTINDAQRVDLTPTLLAPGIYYAALEGSSGSGTYMRQSNQRQAVGLNQYYDRDGGYGALTDPTPAVVDTGSVAPALRIRLA